MNYNIEGTRKIDRLYKQINDLTAKNDSMFEALITAKKRLNPYVKEVEYTPELDNLLNEIRQTFTNRVELQAEIVDINNKNLLILKEMRHTDASVRKRGRVSIGQYRNLGTNLQDLINHAYTIIDLSNKYMQYINAEIELLDKCREKLSKAEFS